VPQRELTLAPFHKDEGEFHSNNSRHSRIRVFVSSADPEAWNGDYCLAFGPTTVGRYLEGAPRIIIHLYGQAPRRCWMHRRPSRSWAASGPIQPSTIIDPQLPEATTYSPYCLSQRARFETGIEGSLHGSHVSFTIELGL
jgi:hypothetical protein